MREPLRCPYCNSVLTPSQYQEVMKKIEKEAQEHKKEIEKELRKKIEEERKKELEKLREQEEKLIEREKELREQEKKLEKRLKEKEYEFRRILKEKKQEYEEKLKEQKKKLRQILDEQMKERLKDEIFKREQEYNQEIDRLRKQYELEIERLTRKTEELQRQLEKATAEEKGEITEEQVFEILEKEFQQLGDKIERVGRGRKGGDILHRIFYNGKECGKILYEVKFANNWLNQWLIKIKKDSSRIGTPYRILVTKTFPKGVRYFGIVDGVPVVHPELLKYLVRIIRGSIIAIERQRLSAFEKEEKINKLYQYLNSDEFTASMNSAFESIKRLNEIREDERRSHENVWAKEQTELQNLEEVLTKISTKIGTIIEKEIEYPIITIESTKDKKKAEEENTK
jgi:hypothetical protein